MYRLLRPVRILFIALVLPGLTISGCGGGSSNPTSPPACLSFTPARTPAAGTITATVDSSTCSSLTLNLMVTEVNQLWGGGVTVRYPATLVRYAGASAVQSTLAQDGNNLIVQGGAPGDAVVGPATGEVTIGITRQGATAPGIDVGATPELLIKVSFAKGDGEGNGLISLIDAGLLDVTQPNAPQPVPYAVTGYGGTASVN